jgi:hypothetical protein|tara:strand:- start:1735 stop:2808 length:1074 start_codon:yes stop_codon:yes gene_type:complete
MATIFKNFSSTDVASTRTLLHEAIPITGSIVSGTYQRGEHGTEENIKNYSHGIFQSVYDYPYLSSSANHILDLTVGYSNAISSSAYTQNTKKVNIYNQMAQMLNGYDHTGSIKKFQTSGGVDQDAMVFFNYARLLTKDEVKKETYTMTFASGGNWNESIKFTNLVTIKDLSGSSRYRVDSPVGEYGYLMSQSAGTGINNFAAGDNHVEIGKVYYQAGIVALTASLGIPSGAAGPAQDSFGVKQESVAAVLTGSTIGEFSNAVRNKINNIAFNNTTELNSTIYFCRIHHNDFNYSSNPTYLSSSKIRVKTNATDQPVTYITSVGLYSADNELLAVAKLSEPLKKDPTNELTLRVRLDY